MGKKLYWATLAVAIVGGLIAIYMTIFKLTSNDAMCLGNGGCSTVNASPYSEIYGIPVAVVGLLGYLAILASLLLENYIDFFKDNGPLLDFGMGLVGVVYSAYLTYLEFYVIHAVCPFCVASAISITLCFIFALIRLIKQPAQ
jgi:uncharacterized membrane protein